MRDRGQFFKYWVPLLVWMVVIFSASSGSFSFQNTSRILAPLLRWLFPEMSREAMFEVIFWIRKCAHVLEYTVLYILFWRAFARQGLLRVSDFKPAWFVYAFVATVSYAITDEVHQAFIAVRQGCVRDVLVDGLGAVLGLCLVWVVARVQLKRRIGGHVSGKEVSPEPGLGRSG